MVTRRIFGRSICRYTLLVHHVILLVTLTTIQQVKSESHPEKYSCESNTEFRSHLQWIPQLIQENRYFKIEAEVVQVATQQIGYVEEQIDFREGLHKLSYTYYEADKKVRLDSLLKQKISEVHSIRTNSHQCKSESFTSYVGRTFTNLWAPTEVYGVNESTYETALGPTSLLMHLTNSSDRLHAYKSKDTTYEQYVYNYCADSYLVKLTLIKGLSPVLKNIRLMQKKDANSNAYELIRQINFYHQENALNASKEQKISDVLPTGHGCRPVHSGENSVPSHSLFGLQGDISFEFVRKETVSKDGTEDLADEQTEIRNERILYDRTHHFSLYEHLDEKQNLVRELLTEDTSTLYTVDEQSGQCQATKIEPIRASEAYLPLHDIRMLFTLWPNAFESTFDFYELGKADERDVFCSIREAVLPVPRSKFNSLKAEYAVVTHYVPTSSFFGTSLSLKLPVNIPISIRIEFFSDIKLTRSLGVYRLNFNQYDYSIQHDNMLDLSGCALHTYDYNWVQMRFPNEPEVINEIKYMRPELQKQVREALQVTPIRLATMNIQFESSAVYVTVKLLQDPGVLAYFGKISNFKLENPSHRRPAENEHLCARQCFKLADCAAFSQCSSMECDLFTDPDFASAYDEDKKSFDYAFDLKMRRKEQDDCNLFIREVSLRSDLGSHLDNRQLIARWNQQVEKSLLRLTFINGKMGNKEIEMIADALSVDVAPGRLLDTVDDLEPTWADELDDERNVERYNDLFRIIFSSNMFDVNQLKAEALSVRQLSWVSLYECQLACANEKTCASYSYCAPYRKCVLTELVPQSLIRNSIVFDSKCVVSQKTNLAGFQRFESRSLTTAAVAKMVDSDDSENLDAEHCAYICLNKMDFDCNSFDYCEGTTTDGRRRRSCGLHEAHVIAVQDEETKMEVIRWKTNETECDHYAKRHAFDYVEYFGQSLVNHDLVSFEDVSLEKCAALCSDTLECGQFDFCLSEPSEGQVEVATCRMQTGTRTVSNVKTGQLSCSLYERKEMSKGTNRRSKDAGEEEDTDDDVEPGGYTKTQVALLSILFLFVGLAVGALLSHFVLDKFF